MTPSITIDNVAYPAKPSMGAMLMFKDQTGKEAHEINAESPTEMVIWLYCCTKAECQRQKVTFDFGLQDFANALDLDALTAWSQSLIDEAASKKKKAKK